MKRFLLLLPVLVGLGGCDDRPDSRAPHGPGDGRYLGLGIYDAHALWQQLAGGEAARDPKAATLADDSEIIVVVDSRTGEVRQCGNMSGRCIAMNPWHPSAGASGQALNKHASELTDEAADARRAKAQP